MSFPTSPIDGQTHNGFVYNSTVGGWDKTDFHKRSSDSTRKSMEFLDGVKLQFGRTADETVWPLTVTFLESFTVEPSTMSDCARSGYYSTVGIGGTPNGLTSFPLYVIQDVTGADSTASSKGHWISIGK